MTTNHDGTDPSHKPIQAIQGAIYQAFNHCKRPVGCRVMMPYLRHFLEHENFMRKSVTRIRNMQTTTSHDGTNPSHKPIREIQGAIYQAFNHCKRPVGCRVMTPYLHYFSEHENFMRKSVTRIRNLETTTSQDGTNPSYKPIQAIQGATYQAFNHRKSPIGCRVMTPYLHYFSEHGNFMRKSVTRIRNLQMTTSHDGTDPSHKPIREIQGAIYQAFNHCKRPVGCRVMMPYLHHFLEHENFMRKSVTRIRNLETTTSQDGTNPSYKPIQAIQGATYQAFNHRKSPISCRVMTR